MSPACLPAGFVLKLREALRLSPPWKIVQCPTMFGAARAAGSKAPS